MKKYKIELTDDAGLEYFDILRMFYISLKYNNIIVALTQLNRIPEKFIKRQNFEVIEYEVEQVHYPIYMIDKETIVVGCQTFKAQSILDLADLIREDIER